MKKLIVVTDWADDSLTRQEFRSAVEGFLQQPELANINYVSSTPSTIHTGYLLAQVVEIEEQYGRPLKTIIFQNTVIHSSNQEDSSQTKGDNFIVIKLKTGIYVCGPNAGYDFSLIKPKIDEIFVYQGLIDKDTHFRSRDLYSRVCAHLIDEMEDEMGLEETHMNIVPYLKGFYIGHIDNYGNIKTTIIHEDIKGKYEFGNEIEVEINKVKKKVTYVPSLFVGSTGQLVIYPGSSGSKDNPYLEISVWRCFDEEKCDDILAKFNYPRPGMEIKF